MNEALPASPPSLPLAAEIPSPHEIQRKALSALESSRVIGNEAGLVVLATGLGKTWLAAFDSSRPEFRRVLFVAHREEILTQAMQTFGHIRPLASAGLFTGTEKLPDAGLLFASIQTLGRARHLQQFPPDAFDYIVVDEFHHAAAKTYRQLIEHFSPRFLLGLTATPERTDGGDLLGLCGENLVFRADVAEGIRAGLLCPFEYFGVPDNVDYANIPWRSQRFDEAALTAAVATESRAENSLQQYRLRAGKRTLAFCCSQGHADFMAEFFCRNSLRAVAVHSGPTSAPRTESLARLQRGELDIVCSVDMFNEGVDLPQVDTVMMLRPTESSIVWLQQFGRGLRQAQGKSRLTVIDYIGNHRNFLVKARTLLATMAGSGSSKSDLSTAMAQAKKGELDLPPGCEVTYELEAVNILSGLLGMNRRPDALATFYKEFREEHGQRPTAIETFHAGFNPRSVRKSHGSWFDFVQSMGDLQTNDIEVLKQRGSLLQHLEVLKSENAFRLLAIQALATLDGSPCSLQIDGVVKALHRAMRRTAAFRSKMQNVIDDARQFLEWVETQLIAAWGQQAPMPDRVFFDFDGTRLHLKDAVAPQMTATLCDLMRELLDWRLAEYLQQFSHIQPNGESFICRMIASSGRPILKLPDRANFPMVPTGPTPIIADGDPLIANFVKLFVNVVHRPESAQNVLSDILRRWFGPNAGLPGTRHQVIFSRAEGQWTMQPRALQADGSLDATDNEQ